MLNAPERHASEPQPTSADSIRLGYHGLASPSRRLEVLIELMRHLDDALDATAIDRNKAAAHRAADELCWEVAGQALQARIRHLLSGRSPEATPVP